MYKIEHSARMSLERSVHDITSYLDETEYNLIPTKLRQTLERSLRLSESFQQDKHAHVGRNSGMETPLNLTQGDISVQNSSLEPGIVIIIKLLDQAREEIQRENRGEKEK